MTLRILARVRIKFSKVLSPPLPKDLFFQEQDLPNESHHDGSDDLLITSPASLSESSRESPQKMQPVGQIAAQAGPLPSCCRTTHMSHLTAMSLPSSNCMAPKGHASTQALHPMQSALSMSTIPQLFLEMASTGHAFPQGAAAQW
jgi:hypothetical protein